MDRRRLMSVVGAALVTGALALPASAQSPSAPTGRIPDKLVFGFVPSVEAQTLLTNAQPLADHLSSTLGIPVENYVPTDYTGVVIGLGTGQVDIGALAPLVLVQAADRFGATVILQSVRFGATSYHTQWFTNKPETYCQTPVVTKTVQVKVNDASQDVTIGFCNGTDTATTGPLGDEEIKKLTTDTPVSFVEQSSASGYIFPAVQMLNAGLGTPPAAGTLFDPSTAVTPIFAGGHDKSVISVCQGDADVGVSFNDARVASSAAAAVIGACGTDLSNVVVFALSPEIPNDGVAVAGDLDPSLKQAIADALLAYGETEEGSAVLQSIYSISNFEPVDLASLDIVRQAAAQIGAPPVE